MLGLTCALAWAINPLRIGFPISGIPIRGELNRGCRLLRMAEDDQLDWRDMRARLVAQERQAGSTAADGDGYAYEVARLS